jgi:uncharacterized iron-regulated membrane protein
MASTRSVIAIIHRWGGLTIGLILAVIGLTGAVPVLLDDTERWVGVRQEVGEGRGAYAPAVANIRAQWPDVRIDKVVPSDAAGRPDTIRVSRGHEHDDEMMMADGGMAANAMMEEYEPEEKWTVFTDPATGTVVGDTQHSYVAGTMRFIAEFHSNLFLPGVIADVVLGLTGLSMLVFAITGLILWWPGIKKWRSGFSLRLNKTSFLFHFDLHRVLAVVTLPLLLAAGITGMFFTWKFTHRAAYYALGGDGDAVPHKLMSKADKLAMYRPDAPAEADLDALVATALTRVPGATAADVLRITSLGGNVGNPARVAIDYVGNGDRRSGGVVVHLDRGGREVVRVDDPRDSAGHWLIAHQWALHAGMWGSSAGVGGIIGRAAWMIGGASALVLAITGVGIWWYRRKQKLQAEAAKLKRAALVKPAKKAAAAIVEPATEPVAV